MGKRYYKKETEAPIFPDDVETLPINRPVAVYYRQSTDAQIGNISTSIQTIDMVTYLIKRGWADENIILIDMDAGVSGTTKIDERAGMKMLFELITDGKVGAVACQDEDRLFRDITQIQVNIFIEACRASNVRIVTPQMVYDFANEMTGSFHIRQFRFKSEMAADYISTVIKGKLHRAKRRLMMEGRWTGFIMLPGYMVDMRKTLPDGSNNPSWKRYVPFPEYAKVVNEYFRIFISYAGNIHATVKHIHAHGSYYPNPNECLPPEGFKFVTRMKQYGHGYCPARNGLVNLLTNAALLGHWAVNGVIVRWNNHEPIVEEELFYQAFNYLSQITLDGHENKHYKPFSQNARPSLESERPVERPLCAGMIVSEHNGELKTVGTVWEKKPQKYIYALLARHPKETIIWRKTALYIDEGVTNLLHEKLRATFSSEVWEKTIDEASKGIAERSRRIQSQLTTLERVMENQILSIETITNPSMLQTIQERYEEAQREHRRLLQELENIKSQSLRLDVLENLRDACEPTLSSWEHMTRDEKRLIMHNFIDRIEASHSDGTGMKIEVFWVDSTSDAVVIAKQFSNGQRVWLDSETEILKQLVQSSAGQVEIASAFSTLTWKRIYYKICKIYGRGKHYYSPLQIGNTETYEQYMEGAKTETTRNYKAGSGDYWIKEDIETLKDMLENGASRLDFLKRFPYRRWQSIVKQFRRIYGNDIMLPQDRRIRWVDNYVDFVERYPEEGQKNTEEHEVTSVSCSSMLAHTLNCWDSVNF